MSLNGYYASRNQQLVRLDVMWWVVGGQSRPFSSTSRDIIPTLRKFIIILFISILDRVTVMMLRFNNVTIKHFVNFKILNATLYII